MFRLRFAALNMTGAFAVGGARLTVSLTDLNLCPCHCKTSMLLELNRPIELGRVDAASLI